MQSLNASRSYSLESRLAEQREAGTYLPIIESLHLVLQIVEGLTVAHRAGKIHPNLRPEFIFIREGNRPAYINFQLTRMSVPSTLEADIRLTKELDYASPEQIQGQELSVRSNFYSLGIILYELLAGHRPEPITSPWDIFDTQSPEFPMGLPLERVRGGLKKETYQLVQDCLWHEEWNRFEDLNKIRVAIDGAIAAEEPSRDKLTKPRRNHLMLYVAVPVFLLIPLLSFMTLWQGDVSDFPLLIFAPQQTAVYAQPTPSKDTSTMSLQSEVTPQQAIVTAKTTATLTTSVEEDPESLVRLIAPLPGSEFVRGDNISFDWSWTEQLEASQMFSVYLLSENDHTLIDTVTKPKADNKYHLEADSEISSSITGLYHWQVKLEERSSGKVLAKSELSLITLSPQNTPTPISTPTVTKTDINPNSIVSATEIPTTVCRPLQLLGWERYIIKSGDTLFNLANRSGVTTENIKQVNCLDQTMIYAGQTLWLPPFRIKSVSVSTKVPTPSPQEQSTSPQPTLSPTQPPTPEPPSEPPSEPKQTKPHPGGTPRNRFDFASLRVGALSKTSTLRLILITAWLPSNCLQYAPLAY